MRDTNAWISNIGRGFAAIARVIAAGLARMAQRKVLAELEAARLEDLGISPAARERECRKRIWER
jgi:uncharacterized protein YjiS (DUF1127 family)